MGLTVLTDHRTHILWRKKGVGAQWWLSQDSLLVG